MTATVNRQIHLVRRPDGRAAVGDFALREAALSEPAPGQIVLRNHYLAIDPAIRQWIAGRGRYIAPIEIGGVVRSVVIGLVVKSAAPAFEEGDWVRALGGWEDYSLVGARDFPLCIPRGAASLTAYLGVLGSAGLAAYFGLHDVARAQAGETVLVSSAAGAVGSLAGQLAKLRGCRAVGIAGSDAKCAWLREIGFDAAINYKAGPLRAALKEHCPKGIDVYFDNVGGDTLEAALNALRRGGRVILCGATSQYEHAAAPRGPSNYLCLLECGGRMEGFVAAHFAERFDEAVTALGELLRAGKLVAREEIVHGLDAAPAALRKVLGGESMGRVIVALDADS